MLNSTDVRVCHKPKTVQLWAVPGACGQGRALTTQAEPDLWKKAECLPRIVARAPKCSKDRQGETVEITGSEDQR